MTLIPPYDRRYWTERTFAGYNGVDWERVLRRDPCSYCGRLAVTDADRRGRWKPTVDHVVSLGAGGKRDSRINGAGACFSCNNAKGTSSLLSFLARRAGCHIRRTRRVVPRASVPFGRTGFSLLEVARWIAVAGGR